MSVLVMSMSHEGRQHHTDVVETVAEYLEDNLSGTRWDEIWTEEEYYHPDGEKKNPVGEFDIVLYNEDDREIYYGEVKTRYKDRSHALDQLERAENHVEQYGFDFIGGVILEPELERETSLDL